MILPEKFLLSQRSMNFRETGYMAGGYKLIDLDTKWAVVDVRVFYSGSGSTCYCALWVSDHKGIRYGYGVGKAGGYGYHRESLAVENAMRDVGIGFGDGTGFGMTGESAEERAIKELGSLLGYENTLLVFFRA